MFKHGSSISLDSRPAGRVLASAQKLPSQPPTAARTRPAQGLGADRVGLVLAHLGLADALARRYRGAGADWSDLRQIARLGLVQAAIRYDTASGNPFVAFAVPTICGEIKRHLRDHGWAVRPPRRIQELRACLSRLAPELAQRLGREPSCAELARALAVTPKEVEEALLSEGSLYLQSLDARQGACEESRHGGWEAAEDVFSRVDEVLGLRCALRNLTPWERRLLALRFQDELSQQQIAGLLGISQMQVSRTLAALLAKLRGQLGGD